MQILQGDCREVLRTLADESVHAVVTDPPYELGFMGKAWDSTGVAYNVDVWRECLRVLKPGGHLLAFGGSRTYHRLACAIEDAGFEIRDQIMWLYGSGFPKSLNVSKALDKAVGAERDVVGTAVYGDGHTQNSTKSIGYHGSDPASDTRTITAPATDAAKQWDGWGTALKPAHEPIVVARKPLQGTVAANVQAHGTGALNIDACRIGESGARNNGRAPGTNGIYGHIGSTEPMDYNKGRWPANIIHDGSEDVLAAFPDAPGQQGDLKAQSTQRKSQGIFGDMPPAKEHKARGKRPGGFGNVGAPRGASTPNGPTYNDLGGSAARFFYCAKASKADREAGCDGLPTKRGGMVSNTSGQHITRRDGGEPGPRLNHHPTVKPTDLMRYLVRLVTPPGGTVLDPFAGSGSTGRAAHINGFNAILIELNPEYIEIARRRIAGDAPLFSSVLAPNGMEAEAVAAKKGGVDNA